MRTTEAARYARWSAAMALLLGVTVAGVYGARSWQIRKARKDAPPAVPSSVEQRTAGFSFSKVVGNRTEFTVRASSATQFSEGGRNVLENVWITSYGTAGQRLDNLHAQSCDYMAASGAINCAGDVQMDLEAAADARRDLTPADHPGPQRVIHAATTHVFFNYQTGVATTDQAVSYSFPQGEGHAVGFRYETQKGELRLLSAVELTLARAGTPTDPPVQAGPDALHIEGSSLTYNRDNRILHLLGPVHARQGRFQLDAGELEADLDPELHPRRIIATKQPELRDTGSAHTSVRAEKLFALASPAGIEKIIAEGHVLAKSRNSAGDHQLLAERAETDLDSKSSQPRRLTATGNVMMRSDGAGGETRTLTTSLLKLNFAFPRKPGELCLEHAATPAATLEWQGPAVSAGKTVTERMRLFGQRLEGAFTESNELRELQGFDGVQLERQIGGGPVQTSTSREMTAHFAPGGDWSIVDQAGDVRLRQSDRTAQAERAHFERASDIALLERSVVLSDPSSRTTAQSAVLHQSSNDLRAFGRVNTSEVSSSPAQFTNLSPGPGRISADQLRADTSTGHAVYSGGARLWQGDSVIEAETIDLDRQTQVLTAVGRVRAIFPQARWTPSGRQPPATQAAGKTEYWRAEGGRLTYMSGENRGRLEDKVRAYSQEGSIIADSMDLFFAPAEIGGEPAKAIAKKDTGASWGASVSGRQLVRALATGNSVAVEQQGRHGTSARADYTAENGKFVLSGGNPTAYDGSGNVARGRQLTFFFGDDSIDVDSAEGLRTVTLHPVEK